jgi:3-(3-hydroxy-phenyl)propionate hydroxylase
MTDGRLTGDGVDCDVAIIGYGPVGATLAGLLARRGVRTTVIDREADIYPLPRAAHVDHEIMRILQELGCADEMFAGMRPNQGMDFLTADHDVLLSMRSPGVTALGWPASVFINQPLFEAQLRATVTRLGATTQLGSGVAAIDTVDTPECAGDHVRLTLEDGSSLTARFVVGCDGARSFTRRTLGIGSHDLEFEEPWLVVDLELTEPVASLPEVALQVCDPARPHTLVPMPEPRFRFEFMLLPGEDPVAMQAPDVVAQLTAGWLPDGAARLERSAVYTFHGLLATKWRAGRVLLAGDAAHQMPPFLGQGMCSGMRDAANLAWKLHAVLQGASEALLDTYQQEREPHVRSIVEAAVGFGRIICTLDAAAAADRDKAMLAARVTAPGAQDTSEGVPMAPLTGPLVGSGGGRPSFQPVIDGRRLDDLVGPGWAVVVRHEAGAAGAWWLQHGALVLSAEDHPQLMALLNAAHAADGTPADAVVVRPDRYVLGGAPSLEELTALVGPFFTGD